ncbi:MAG: threonylcarbamoyl-AMP synthase [Bacteroidetes bacterium]|nr:threonylcarbamoyl-AMP synthase [Bacteroidota bacterium]
MTQKRTQIITDINLVAADILKGNIVGIPTETVYGLGANALDTDAVIKIFEAKERPRFNPLIVHLLNKDNLDEFVEEIPESFLKLYVKFSPGPITYVLKKKKLISDIVTAGNETVAVRFPSHKVFRELLEIVKVPIAAPSANRFGRISPTSAEDVVKEMDGKLKYVLEGGSSDVGIESTVVDLSAELPIVLRHGYISEEEIESVIGKTGQRISEKINSPGMLLNHYAPHTPLVIVEHLSDLDRFEGKNYGILDLNKYSDLKEAAKHLFSDLRRLDEKGFEMILAAKVKDEGIGIAINDRLEKARFKN